MRMRNIWFGLAAISLGIGMLTACGSANDTKTEPAPKSKPQVKKLPEVAYELTANFEDPGDVVNPAWVQGIRTSIIDGGDGGVCPVGELRIIARGLGTRKAEIEDEDFVVGEVSTTGANGTNEGICRVGHGGGGMNVFYGYVPRATSAENFIQLDDLDWRDESYSQPQVFMGGEAWVQCYTNGSTGLEVCGGNWFADGLVIQTDLFLDPAADPQFAADWFAAVLPAVAGVAGTPTKLDATISHAWKNSQGYSFTWDVFDPTITVATNVVDQAPGEALISATIAADVEVANTTPNRNAGPGWAELRPAWPTSSRICQLNERTSPMYYMDPDTFGYGPETGYCYLEGPREIGLDGALDVGGTYAGPYTGSFGSELSAIKILVPEDQLDAIVGELEKPAFWMLVRGSGDAGVATEAKSLKQHRCDARFGATVVATSTAGFDICEQDVQ